MIIPLRARLIAFRQRIILTVRWWFRLEIDDIKERNVQAQIEGLIQLNASANEALRTMGRVISHLQTRLTWYETHIPRMRELKRQFEREQEKLQQGANGTSEEAKERLAHGIVGAIRQ